MIRKMILIAVSFSFLVLPGIAGAGNLSYTFLEGGYGEVDIDDPDIDGDGWAVGGSVGVTDWVHLYANYQTVDFDNLDAELDQWGAGVGVSVPVGDRADIVGEIGYINSTLDTFFGDIDDDGYSVSAAIRGRVADPFELAGGVTYADLDDAGDDTTFFASARYYFVESFAVGAGYSVGDDVSSWLISLRWEMPKK